MSATASTQQCTHATNSALIRNGQVIHSFTYSAQEGYAHLKAVLPLLRKIKEENMAYEFVVESSDRLVQYKSIQEVANTEMPEGFYPIQHGDGEKIDILTIIDAAAILNPGVMTSEEIEELKDWLRHG